MTLNYYIADVFTHQMFAGAQLAVFPKSDDLNAEQMAVIAKELNLPESVFVSNPNGDNTTRKMRIFSPLDEIDYAGHPIIATAYALAECGDIKFNESITTLNFIQNTGGIEVNVSASNNKVSFVQFTDKVSSVVDRFTPSTTELAELLSIKDSEIDHKKYTSRLVSCGFPYLIVPEWNYQTVRKAKFNFTAWNHSTAPQTSAQEILLFSPKTPFKDANFNARLL